MTQKKLSFEEWFKTFADTHGGVLINSWSYGAKAAWDYQESQLNPEGNIRFDFINSDGNEDSKVITHDEMRERYANMYNNAYRAFATDPTLNVKWVGYYWIDESNRQAFKGTYDTVEVGAAARAQKVYIFNDSVPFEQMDIMRKLELGNVGLCNELQRLKKELRQVEEEAAKDTDRLNWLEEQAKLERNNFGISFDWVRSAEGESSGFRFMRRFFVGPAMKTLRNAIDAARGLIHE